MREDLALSHLLLNQARILHRQISARKDLKVEEAIKQLIDNLNITYQRQAQNYLISSQILDQQVSLTTEKKTFQFYQRADGNRGDAPHYQVGEDPVAKYNHHQANQILLDLLLQVNISLPSDIIQSTAHQFSKREKILDYAAWLAVSIIALLSAMITWYQGTRTFNAIDNTYTLEIAWRILNGEVPYRDFNLVVAPGIYVKQALLMKLFGNEAIVGVWWCMFAMAITVLLTFIVLKLIDTPRFLAVNLSVLAAVGGNVVRPYVWYDVDALIFCLASLALLLWSEKQTNLTKALYGIGLLTGIPIIFKQNLGTANMVIITGIIYLQWLFCSYRFTWRRFLLYHLGLATSLAIVILPFWYLGALSDLYYYNFSLPFKLRVANQSLISVMGYFLPQLHPDLSFNLGNSLDVNILPFFIGTLLTWGTLLLGTSFWFAGTHRSIVRLLLPFWLFGISLAGIYALRVPSIFPLLALLAIMLAMAWQFMQYFINISKASYYSIQMVVILIAFALLSHALAGYQLFFYNDAFTEPTPFKIAGLKGMYANRDYVPGVEEIVEYVNHHIPVNESLALIITEDPLYFLTARRSPLRIIQRYTNSGGDPKTIYLSELKRVEPIWVVVKTSYQFRYWQPLTQVEKDWLSSNYQQVDKLKQYQIWKKKS